MEKDIYYIIYIPYWQLIPHASEFHYEKKSSPPQGHSQTPN